MHPICGSEHPGPFGGQTDHENSGVRSCSERMIHAEGISRGDFVCTLRSGTAYIDPESRRLYENIKMLQCGRLAGNSGSE